MNVEVTRTQNTPFNDLHRKFNWLFTLQTKLENLQVWEWFVNMNYVVSFTFTSVMATLGAIGVYRVTWVQKKKIIEVKIQDLSVPQSISVS